MLKGLNPILTADLLWLLGSMRHGDTLVLCDRHFPASSIAAGTVTGRWLELLGTDTTKAADAILSLLPLDSYVELPVIAMAVVGDPEAVPEVHADMQAVVNDAEGRHIHIGRIDRFAFYEAARKAYAVVQTTDSRLHGCFIFKVGIVV